MAISPKKLSISEVPNKRAAAGRKASPHQRIVNDSVAQAKGDILLLIEEVNSGLALDKRTTLHFVFTPNDHPSFRETYTSQRLAENSARRSFRKALHRVGLSDQVNVTYTFHLERQPTGEIMASGYEAWVTAKDRKPT